MEAPNPQSFITVKEPMNKPDSSIKFNLKSDKNLDYDISIYYIEDMLYFSGVANDIFQNKTFEKKYSYLHESIKEVYDELDALVKNYKDINEIKLLEETNKLIIIFPLNTVKIKECIFEIDELFLKTEQKYEKVFNKLKEMLDKILDDNNLLKKEINELKEGKVKSFEGNNLFEKEINDLKEN